MKTWRRETERLFFIRSLLLAAFPALHIININLCTPQYTSANRHTVQHYQGFNLSTGLPVSQCPMSAVRALSKVQRSTFVERTDIEVLWDSPPRPEMWQIDWTPQIFLRRHTLLHLLLCFLCIEQCWTIHKTLKCNIALFSLCRVLKHPEKVCGVVPRKHCWFKIPFAIFAAWSTLCPAGLLYIL